jgi:TPR repeat protein
MALAGISPRPSTGIGKRRKRATPVLNTHWASVTRKGEGVPKDEAEAFKWCLKAAEQNLAEAQVSLVPATSKAAALTRITSKRLSGFGKPPSRVLRKPNQDSLAATSLVLAWKKTIGSADLAS